MVDSTLVWGNKNVSTLVNSREKWLQLWLGVIKMFQLWLKVVKSGFNFGWG